MLSIDEIKNQIRVLLTPLGKVKTVEVLAALLREAKHRKQEAGE